MAENDNKENKGKGSESDSKKTNTNTDAFDPKSLSDEDFSKVFEDPRLFEHTRFKELNDKAKAGVEAQKKLDEYEKTRLEEEGKHKELAEKYKQEAEEAKKQAQAEKINNALLAEAQKQGAVDTDSVLKLVDKSKIQVSEDGNVSGTEDAVKGLLEGKPFLKSANANTTNIGSGTQPGDNTTGIKKFTHSQIQDPRFYQENEADILQAMKTGNIVNDLAPGGSTPGPKGPQ